MQRTAACPSCQRGVFAEDAFCSWCGASIQERDARSGESRRVYAHRTIPTRDRQGCTSCNSPILPGDEFCSTCGARTGAQITIGGLSESWRTLGLRLGDSSRGKYQVVRELGRGGMGVVLMARDTELERPVAIKVLSPSLLGDESMVARFQREARTIASLRHQSIVSVYDVGRAGDLHYFVMDFIDGVSLSRVLRTHGPLPIPVVQTFLLQVGSALAHAHRPGRTVIHRDVKPSNIMIDPEGAAVVTDFGISKVTETPGGLTKTGLVIGTPEYMSPEQCRGTTVTAASDQYSLGAVVFAMLTGAPPFTGAFYKVLMAHQNEAVPPLLEARPDCPRGLAEATERMLAKRPADRWPSVREALRTLRLQTPLSGDPVLDTIAELVRSTEEGEGEAGESGRDRSSRTPASVEITPIPGDLEIGDQMDLSATVLFNDGHQAVPSEVSWESTDPSILRIDADTGELVAVGAGEARVTAKVAGVARSVDLAVREAAVAELIVDPDALELEVGESRSVTAEPRSRRGEQLDRPVIWSSSNPRTVSVSELGVVKGHREGTASVLAHCRGCGASAEIRVVPAIVAEIKIAGAKESFRVGDSLVLDATPLDRRDQSLDRPVTWTTSAPAVAEVDANGRVRAASEGEAHIHARCEDRHASVAVQVLPAPVASLAIDDEPEFLSVGDRADLRAVAWDREGRVLDRDVEWSSEHPKVLRVDADGSIEALEEGEAAVVARCEDQKARVTLEVRPAPITRIDVSAPADELLVGDTFHLEATMFDRRDEIREGSPDWTVDDPEVLALLAPGLFRALGQGEVVVTASAGEATTRVPLSIGAEVREPAGVEEAGYEHPVGVAESPQEETSSAVDDWEPEPVAVAEPGKGEDFSSEIEEGEVGVPAGTSDTPPPLFSRRGVWVGAAILLGAVAGGWMLLHTGPPPPGPAVTEVRIVTADGQELLDGSISLVEGDSLVLAGLALGPDGTPTDEVPQWRTSDPAVTAVDSTGLLITGMPGVATLEAFVDTISAVVEIEVAARPDQIVIVGPDGGTAVGEALRLDAEEPVRLRARVLDPRGEEMALPVSWRSSVPSTARVDESGVVTAVSEGPATITASAGGLQGQLQVNVNASARPPGPQSGPAELTIIIEGHWAYATLDGDTLNTRRITVTNPWSTTVETRPGATHTLRVANDDLGLTPLDTAFVLSPGANDTIRTTLIRRHP